MEEENTRVKVMLLGPPGVGKTAIIYRFMYGQFHTDYEATVGIDYFTRHYTQGDKTTVVQIFDTAGQERFSSLVSAYMRDANIAVVAFDLSDAGSLTEGVRQIEAFRDSHGTDVPIILVGNKLDLNRALTKEEVRDCAKLQNVRCFETSAATGEGIEELFTCVAEIAQKPNVKLNPSPSVRLVSGELPKEEPKKGCCFS